MEWIWVPIVAILAGSFNEWLKFKQKQERLGTSTHELKDEVEAMRAERERLTARIQNLEAIVTSEAWDSISEPTAPQQRIQVDEPSDEERIASMARKLRS